MSTLSLGDGLTIKNADSVCALLKEASGMSRDVVVSIDFEQQIDLCGLQLIESARKSFLRLGQSLRLSEPATPWLDMIECAGLVVRGEDAEFWLHRGSAQ